jgi:hypothetical protein
MFIKVFPVDYRRALLDKKNSKAQGEVLSVDTLAGE